MQVAEAAQITTLASDHPVGESGNFSVPQEIRVVRSIAEVEALRDVWSSWRGHRDSDIDFFKEFIRVQPEVIRPHVIVVYRDNVPEAMLVGRLQLNRLEFRIGYLRFPSVMARSLVFSQGGARGNITEVSATQILRSIHDSLRNGEADFALLHQVDAESPLFRIGVAGMGFATRDHASVPEPRYGMVLPSTVDQLYEGFSRAARQGFRRKKNRLLKEFGERFRIDCIASPTEYERVLPELEQIAAKTYQRGLGVGFASTPQDRRTFQFFAEKGWLRIYVLYLHGKACAFLTGTLLHDSFAADFTGYDPAYRDLAVGSVIAIGAVEDLCRQGVKRVDLGSGESQYKRQLSNLRTMETNLHIFAPTVKGATLNLLRTSTVVMDRAVKRSLDQMGLLQGLKRFWRRRLSADKAESHDERS